MKSLIIPMLLIGLPASLAAAPPRLVPEAPSLAPNYWCTWYAQNYWIGRGSDLKSLKGVTNAAARDELNEHTLFNPKDGWATTYLPNSRQDYIFLIDHGWQTKDPSKRIAGGPAFFNLVAEEEDFPRYAGLEPGELLKRFNEDIKAEGWNSLGIWTRGNITPDQARTFVEWSKDADIRYWKIDGGDTAAFYSYQAKQEIFPELVLEYVTGAGGNLNPKWDRDLPSYPSVYDFGGNLRKPMLRCLKNSDVFRTYDASPLLMTSTTLRRTHDILKQTQQQPEYQAVLNVQDDCNVAVGLGVLVASKRHPEMGERTYKGRDLHHQLSGPRTMQKRINEVDRFGRWARIAPAFPAGEGVYLSSETELIDRCQFTEWDTWASNTYGKMVSQSAPAVMARNMPLAVVDCDGPPPFVCTTTYPNGPTGIAVEGRVAPDQKWFEPRARITVRIKDASQPIGIVGHYESLTLEFAGELVGLEHVWAQDLLADEAVDIRSKIVTEGSRLVLPGKLLEQVGTAAGSEGDLSAPGLVIRLEGRELPVAGEDYLPEVSPAVEEARVAAQETKVDGYRGEATLRKVDGGYRVGSDGPRQWVLRKLDEPVTTGTVSFTWRMKPVGKSAKKNGFLLLASDEDANAALCGGAWLGANEITLFENDATWGNDESVEATFNEETEYRLEVDLDRREAKLSAAGKVIRTAFSESFTSISHVGFGVHHAETEFTTPVMK